LEKNRVFVDVKDFLEQVLRVPKDWRTSEKYKAMKDDVDAKETGYALYNGQDGPCVIRDGESYCRLAMSSF